MAHGESASVVFSKPTLSGREKEYLGQVLDNRQMAGGKFFSKKCEEWFKEYLGCASALMTPSCTAALEMSAFLIDCQAGDEIIMPSFTFVSTANAFVLRGAKIVFVDIDPVTMNVSAQAIEDAITEKTKAIVIVHYAGVACDMDAIMEISQRHDLFLIEDAAQAILSNYKGKPLGSFGHFSCFSFHETKNISCGEGGMLVVNDPEYAPRAEIIREKGTNRRQFISGLVDKYTWMDVGSSYLASELQAAHLLAQLEASKEITKRRMAAWDMYEKDLTKASLLEFYGHGVIPDFCDHNAHIYFLKLDNLEERNNLIEFSSARGVQMNFHYIPLHSSPGGIRFGRFAGTDRYTTKESQRLIRLPIYTDITREDQARVIGVLSEFKEAR